VQVALVHDYLNQMGGAEKVLLALHDIFPQAPIYTSVYAWGQVDRRFRDMDIRTSFMQRLPLVKAHPQPFLPLYPLAFEQLDLRAYDLVISDSSAFAKGVLTRPEALHICYCHTPMRWAWNYQDYVQQEHLGALSRLALAPTVMLLRQWDYVSAARVDYFVANSPTVAHRIAKYYRRESVYIPPPVETSRFAISPCREEYFLILSRLVPYKRIDLAISAFNKLKLPLHIIGTGRDEPRLRRLAGPSIHFKGHQSSEEISAQMAACRALIFPGEEDFGITPVEAEAAGRPVIAYGAGGALTSVVPGKTGLFFTPQTAEALADVVSGFKDDDFDPLTIRRHALVFDTKEFTRRFSQFVETRIATHPSLSHFAAQDTRPGSPQSPRGPMSSPECRDTDEPLPLRAGESYTQGDLRQASGALDEDS
jgi:glycosyltransferase involved in cell wall biosynthesis